MGTKITVSGSNYALNINNDFDGFNALSDKVADITYNSNTGALSLRNNGASGDYNWAASKDIISATITMATTIGTELSPAVIIGVDTSGNALTLFLDGTGNISKFPKTGVLGSLNAVYSLSPAPTRQKGDSITVTQNGTSFTVSYSGYSKTVLYSVIPNWSYPVIGVLAGGTAVDNYTFVIN